MAVKKKSIKAKKSANKTKNTTTKENITKTTNLGPAFFLFKYTLVLSNIVFTYYHYTI